MCRTIMMVHLIVLNQLPPRVEVLVAVLAIVVLGALHVMLLQSQRRFEVHVVKIAKIVVV